MKLSDKASTRSTNRFKTLLDDFNKEHNYKYNYDKFIYEKSKIKSTITCIKHGDFKQSANDHLNGYGCPKCGRNIVEVSSRKGTNFFIKEANSKHGYFIDYSKVVYKNNSIPVILSCPIHGEFTQRPAVHLTSKFPCPECSSINRGILHRNTTQYFIDRAKIIHGDTYTYTRTIVNTTNDKVIITCKTHGDFLQLQSNHLSGNGCPKCGLYGFQDSKPAILYYVSINNGTAYKIGITNRTIKERFGKDYSKITILGYASFLNGKDARERESQILQEFAKYKYTGTNLLASGNTELFTKDILNLTKDYSD